jgi:RNA polymerase sigma-70 factor (ECF subfamily)
LIKSRTIPAERWFFAAGGTRFREQGMGDVQNPHYRMIGQMFQKDYRWLCAAVGRTLGCPHSAQDIASETFLRVLALPDPSAIREPRALLTTIARRLVYEGWRRQDLERAYLESLALAPEPVHPSPEERALVIEALLAVDRLLNGLSAKAKAAFLYHQLDGLTYSEIGQQLGVSTSRVQQYMVEAFKRCYQAMQA